MSAPENLDELLIENHIWLENFSAGLIPSAEQVEFEPQMLSHLAAFNLSTQNDVSVMFRPMAEFMGAKVFIYLRNFQK